MQLRRLTLLTAAVSLAFATAGIGAPGSTRAAEEPAPLVAVDPGHGGRDIGAVGEANGRTLVEQELTLVLARRLAELLRAGGYRTLLTRSDEASANRGRDVNGDGVVDLADDLQARVDAANAAGAAVLVSVHFNGSTDHALRGPGAYYSPDRPFAARSRALAQQVMAAVDRGFRSAGRPVPPGSVHADADLGGGPLFLLGPASGRIARASAMPGVLVEGLFLTNPEDAARLADPTTIELLATAYAGGVAAYLGPPAARARVAGPQGAFLRPAPLLATQPLTLLPPGAKVDVAEHTAGDVVRGSGDWWRVDWNGQPGYVLGRLLTPLAAEATVGPPPTSRRATVRPDPLPARLRGAPTRAAPILARARPGDVLDVLGEEPGEAVDGVTAGWLRVRAGEAVGWVWAPLLAEEGAAAPPTPSSTVRVRDGGDGLSARLRAAPTRDSAIVARARPGSALEVVGRADGEPVDGKERRWLKVRQGGALGWVWASLVDG
ncbi:MAG TPA: N-acetylmuramoyl-L-alanine amidase [Chloroflexota bacterium]